MAQATASDGVQLHWEERGAGPTVILAAHWSVDPNIFGPITAELEGDHRVVRYDERGTGRSERVGPFDIATGVIDLEAVAETAGGGPALVLGLMDGMIKGVRLAASRPDLVSHVVGPGGAPLGRAALSGAESMIASDAVVGAFMQQLETDYRGATRAMAEAANPQMSQDEIRARVNSQVDHIPVEAALARVRSWSDDTETEASGRELGDRMACLLSASITGGWFPEPDVMRPLLRERFPEAIIEEVDDGIISRPDQTAAVIRRMLSAVPAADLESST